MSMQIWIDGDACPRIIKDIVFRAAIRTQTQVMVVANHALSVPTSSFIKKWQVGAGFDVVDTYIVTQMNPGDLVITADLPFADAIVTKGGVALNPRGELYDARNIKQHLAIRNMNDSLRSSQLLTGGPAKLGQKDVRDFANRLDTLLANRANA